MVKLEVYTFDKNGETLDRRSVDAWLTPNEEEGGFYIALNETDDEVGEGIHITEAQLMELGL